MANMLAYADCSIQVLTNGDPRLCDCTRIVDIPIAPDRPDKQKNLALKTDWKYIGTCFCEFSCRFTAAPTPMIFVYQLAGLSSFSKTIFHPPQV